MRRRCSGSAKSVSSGTIDEDELASMIYVNVHTTLPNHTQVTADRIRPSVGR